MRTDSVVVDKQTNAEPTLQEVSVYMEVVHRLSQAFMPMPADLIEYVSNCSCCRNDKRHRMLP